MEGSENILSKENEIELAAHEALKEVIDPEVGLNIIEMGLVYLINYSEQNGIRVEMTLTSKGCPLGDSMKTEVERILTEKFPGKIVNIQLVWEPSWTTKFITPGGLQKLGHQIK